jgi:hypothetical protein
MACALNSLLCDGQLRANRRRGDDGRRCATYMSLTSSSPAVGAEGVRSGLRDGQAHCPIGNFVREHSSVGPLAQRHRRCLTLMTRADFLPFDGAGCKRAWRWPPIRRPGKTRKGAVPSLRDGVKPLRQHVSRSSAFWPCTRTGARNPIAVKAPISASMFQSIRRHRSAARRRLTKGPVTSSLPGSLMMGRCPR